MATEFWKIKSTANSKLDTPLPTTGTKFWATGIHDCRQHVQNYWMPICTDIFSYWSVVINKAVCASYIISRGVYNFLLCIHESYNVDDVSKNTKLRALRCKKSTLLKLMDRLPVSGERTIPKIPQISRLWTHRGHTVKPQLTAWDLNSGVHVVTTLTILVNDSIMITIIIFIKLS